MAGSRRRGEDLGYVLHAQPWRETSLVLDVWTHRHGRLRLAARGARRPHSALRAVLLTFQPLWLRWSGKGEVMTLTGADWVGGVPLLTGEALWCGYYLNELVLALAPREFPYPAWFAAYDAAVRALAAGEAPAPVLRAFEWATLQATGHAPAWPDQGPAPLVLSQAAAEAIARGEWASDVVAREVRPWLRAMLEHCLEGRVLKSRAFMREWVLASEER